MPRFFFDMDDSSSRSHDMEGDVLVDIEAASEVALTALYEMVGDKMTGGPGQRAFTVSVRDGRGKVVYNAAITLHVRRFMGEQASGASDVESQPPSPP